ncbi:MAG: hypothetical protein K2X81_23185, partial [Candidatus Obscuribacterales bacterium]|nr:hypothetical protein [Candidatus Obscuribacterales bacterium]
MEDFSNARNIRVEDDVQPHALQSEWMESSRTAGAKLMAELRNDSRERRARVNDAADKLEFDYVPVGRISVLSSITLPDGGKVTRVTEPLSGRDGET